MFLELSIGMGIWEENVAAMLFGWL